MKNSLRPYAVFVAVWLALLLLLGITVATSFIPLGGGNTLVNGLVALAKAGLVVVFYMQMRSEVALIRIVALIAVMALSLLFLLSGLDYATRLTEHAPWQSTPPSLYVEPPAPLH
jgi:cytochrome c oxidase subunit 4